MYMTLFCDASLCGQTNAAGWGAWAKVDGWPSGMIFGGQFKRLMTSSGEAELCAIANALHMLDTGTALDGLKAIMVQSDSVQALSQIAARLKVRNNPHEKSAWVPQKVSGPGSKTEREALDVIRHIMIRRQLDLTVRHVKGHQKGGSRSWVNKQCDKVAKKHMRAAREALSNGKDDGSREGTAGSSLPVGHANV